MATATRRFVSSLRPQESVDQVFLASEKQLRPNKSGNLYLQLLLGDRSGSVEARMWNADEGLFRGFENGDYVHVEGNTQLFQGALQLIVGRLRRVKPGEVNEADFLVLPPAEVERMAGRMTEILRGVVNPHLRNLAECVLMDDELMSKMSQAPAGIRHHHAYRGGLLEHVLSLMEVILRVAPLYPQLDQDQLLLGALLHDLSKVDEMTYERDLAYSTEGQLVGHIVMGVSLLDTKVREAERLAGEPIPDELVLRLKHMIVSHHGQQQYGSPKQPMTLEATALHHLDNLDAKIHCFQQLLRDDANLESEWTQYQHHLGLKVFKGGAE